MDTRILIVRLKNENEQLKKELEVLRGEGSTRVELDQQKRAVCEKMVNDFLQQEQSRDIMIVDDKLVLKQCLVFIRDKFLQLEEKVNDKTALK